MDKAAGRDKSESGRAEGLSNAPAPSPATTSGLLTFASSAFSRPPAAPPLRLLDALPERLRYMHYSLRTDEAYVYVVRGFDRWAGLRHPRDLGAAEVQEFLVMLANERRVAAATHRQALSALLPWLRELGRPAQRRRIPVVLTHVEVQALLAQMGEGVTGLLGRLLYGTGMRLLEGVRLRNKDHEKRLQRDLHAGVRAAGIAKPATVQPCATRSPPTCCRRAPTSAPCSSCSAMPT